MASARAWNAKFPDRHTEVAFVCLVRFGLVREVKVGGGVVGSKAVAMFGKTYSHARTMTKPPTRGTHRRAS